MKAGLSADALLRFETCNAFSISSTVTHGLEVSKNASALMKKVCPKSMVMEKGSLSPVSLTRSSWEWNLRRSLKD